MPLDQHLITTAITLAQARWPFGEGGAAAMYTHTGRVLTSVFAESPNSVVGLCHETGAICEAHKLDERIVATVCVSRLDERSPFVILPPCGVCCERLAFWGGSIEVALPNERDATRWHARRLRDVMPHYWRGRWDELELG